MRSIKYLTALVEDKQTVRKRRPDYRIPIKVLNFLEETLGRLPKIAEFTNPLEWI